MWPKVVALLSLQVGFYFFARMGDAELGVGNYSAFQYARNLQSFAVSLFGISLATAVFPFLSEFAAEKKMEHFMHRFEKSLRQILFLALPATVGMAVLAPHIVRFIYGARPANVLTVFVLVPLALAIPFESINHLLVRTFHVLKNTFLPMISSLLFLGVLIGLSSLLVVKYAMGVAAFGIAYAAGIVIQILFLFACLSRLAGTFPWKSFYKKLSKVLGLTLVMGIVVFFLSLFFRDAHFFVSLFIPAAVGGCIFIGGALLLKLPEIQNMPFWKGQKEK
jgi:putative peptidoglycan lipid II flippase